MNRESIIELIIKIGFNCNNKYHYNFNLLDKNDKYTIEFYSSVILLDINGERLYNYATSTLPPIEFIENDYNEIHFKLSDIFKEKLRCSKIDNLNI